MNEHVSRLVARSSEVRPKNRYGRLRVLGEPFWVKYERRWKSSNVVCECSCKTVCIADCNELAAGKTRSCGCTHARVAL